MWPFDIFQTTVRSSFRAVKKDVSNMKLWLSWLFTSQKNMDARLQRLEKRVWELEAEMIR